MQPVLFECHLSLGDILYNKAKLLSSCSVYERYNKDKEFTQEKMYQSNYNALKKIKITTLLKLKKLI